MCIFPVRISKHWKFENVVHFSNCANAHVIILSAESCFSPTKQGYPHSHASYFQHGHLYPWSAKYIRVKVRNLANAKPHTKQVQSIESTLNFASKWDLWDVFELIFFVQESVEVHNDIGVRRKPSSRHCFSNGMKQMVRTRQNASFSSKQVNLQSVSKIQCTFELNEWII